MPCSDSSSSFTFRLDTEDRLTGFEFAKITCGKEISAKTGLSDLLKRRTLQEILCIPYGQVVKDLKAEGEEAQFILYLEWDALRSAAAHYLGDNDPDIDHDRCRISSVEQTASGTEVALVILPPRELPKILPCGLSEQQEE